MSPKRRKRRSHNELIADLQAQIEAIKAKAEAQKAKRDPALRHVASAARSLEKAMATTQDRVLRKNLNEAQMILTSCLAEAGLTPDKSQVRGGSRARRPRGAAHADLDEVREALMPYLRANPGQRGEEIAASLGIDTTTLRAAMKPLMEAGKIRTEGQRRGTRYFPG